MIKSEPILAVKDVEASSKWYQQLFGCKSKHGGKEFDVLVSDEDEVLICLHKWGEHEHATMIDSDITPGNGLIIYFRADNLSEIFQRAESLNCHIDKEIHLNENSGMQEFSLRDPDGYYLTVSSFHIFKVVIPT